MGIIQTTKPKGRLFGRGGGGGNITALAENGRTWQNLVGRT
jgi:hypothetical protein